MSVLTEEKPTIETSEITSLLDDIELHAVTMLKDISNVNLVQATQVQDCMLDILSVVSTFKESLTI